jgi:hypothetical protein
MRGTIPLDPHRVIRQATVDERAERDHELRGERGDLREDA